MHIDNGMIPQRGWAAHKPQGRELGARSVLPSLEFLAGAVVFAGVMLNLALSGLNANGFTVTRGHVVLTEVLVVVAALALCARSFNRLMMPWIGVALLLVMCFAILSVFRQSLDPKYIRDVLLIPVFVALGTTFVRGNIVRLFVTLQAVILAIMIFEGVWTESFGTIINPKAYYINSRDVNEAAFWMADSDLYISSFRPPNQGRFFTLFGLLGDLRLSAVFLEPVSLGNWCVVVTVFMTTLWRDLSRTTAIFFVLSTIAILVGSDGRFATISIALIVVLSFIVRVLPRYSYFLYLPGAVVVTFILVDIFQRPISADDFMGRLSFSAFILSSMDVSSVLGLDKILIQRSADSGISYFILTQTIVGVGILWLSICFLQPPVDRMTKMFMHGICVYMALILMISFSMFSIKTAAPLWFLYGYVRARSAAIS